MMTGIIAKLEKAEVEQEKRQNCEHEFKTYIGKRTCCSKCWGLAEGMEETWIEEHFNNL